MDFGNGFSIFGHFRAQSSRKWPFDSGTYQLKVPALKLKTQKRF
jgi:hypothetical protein